MFRRVVSLATLTSVVLVASSSPVSVALADEEKESQTAPTEDPPACSCRGLLTPTQVADLFWGRLAAEPEFERQMEIVSTYMELLDPDAAEAELSRLDRLALGEAMFLTFEAQRAHDLLEPLLDGTDLVARHAWDRVMQIRFRAFDRADEVRSMIGDFKERFPLSEIATRGHYQQTGNFVNRYLQEDRTEDAIDMLFAEIERLPVDAPYMAYSLVTMYAEQIRESAAWSRLHAIVRAKADGLRRSQEIWRGSTLPAEAEWQRMASMPEWYWLQQGVRPGESLRSARARQLEGLIAALEDWLAEASLGARHLSDVVALPAPRTGRSVPISPPPPDERMRPGY